MNEQTGAKAKRKETEAEGIEPVHMVRKGSIALVFGADKIQAALPTNYDYSLSRSLKSMSREKTGYSRNFFETNLRDLVEVIENASHWIVQKRESEKGLSNAADDR